jgi:hypothetical protein
VYIPPNSKTAADYRLRKGEENLSTKCLERDNERHLDRDLLQWKDVLDGDDELRRSLLEFADSRKSEMRPTIANHSRGQY